MTEKSQITSGPRYDAAYFLGDQHRMEMLLGDSTKDPFLAKAKRSFKDYSADQLTELTGILLTNIGRDNKIWNKDRKRAAIQLLTVVPIGSEKMDRIILLKQYVAILERQLDESADPSGSISSLLDAGILIARFFPLIDGKNEMIEKALEKTLEKYYGKPGADIIIKKSALIKRKLKNPGKTTESNTDKESIYPTTEEIKPLTDRLPPTAPKLRSGNPSRVRERSKSPKPTSEEILMRLRSNQSNASLTQRQLAVLALIHEQGWTYTQVARTLGMGNSDVDRINRHALRVMGIQIDD